MPIVLKKGDLFTTKCGIIAHGCNTKGGFGSGVAGIIAKKYPKARDSYLRKFNTVGWKLGDIQYIKVANELIIANMATQESFGYDGAVYASYEAITQAFTQLIKDAYYHGYSVAMPRIGTGLGGLEWSKVQNILIKAALLYPDVLIEVYSL